MKSAMRAAGFISGGGSTWRRIVDECFRGDLQGVVEPVLVIASCDCDGKRRAIEAGMNPDDVLTIAIEDFDSPEAHAYAIIEACMQRGVDFIGQYGYLKLTHPIIIDVFQNMIINQHPGPLDFPCPDFGGQGMYGQRVHRCILEFAAAVDWQFEYTEATAHIVTENYDEGTVVGRRPLKLRPDHTPKSLADELLPEEHDLQVDVIHAAACGRLEEVVRAELLIPEQWIPTHHEIYTRIAKGG